MCLSIAILQRELYPSLLLFPAGRKKAIPYGGDIVVSNIINFLAHHGGHFYDLLQEKGEFPDLKISTVFHQHIWMKGKNNSSEEVKKYHLLKLEVVTYLESGGAGTNIWEYLIKHYQENRCGDCVRLLFFTNRFCFVS